MEAAPIDNEKKTDWRKPYLKHHEIISAMWVSSVIMREAQENKAVEAASPALGLFNRY